jgi:hypothetical protein
MYHFDSAELMSTLYLTWHIISSVPAPEIGLADYGFGVTNSGTIVLYGGQIEKKGDEGAYTLYNNLWIFNLSDANPSFQLASWKSSDKGGISRIISLGNETICIFNSNFEKQMRILDLHSMTSYDPYIENAPINLVRTAFGIAGTGKDFIIYGGYDESKGEVNALTPFNILYQLTFSDKTRESELNTIGQASLDIIVTIIVVAAVMILFSIYFYVRYKNKLFDKEKQLKKEKMKEEAIIALENSKKAFEDRVKNLVDDPEFTATLAISGKEGLFIPGYREAQCNTDFQAKELLAQGGMGKVSIGKLLRHTFIDETGSDRCVIKEQLKQAFVSLFLQELSIHEVFRGVKYFAQLICYSFRPCCIVLRYYEMGSLKDFIYKQDKNPVLKYILYDLQLCVTILKKTAWALNMMHSKGYIHCDVKPDNILLNQDKEEELFPVITDFGLTYITTSAEAVKGMGRVAIPGGTIFYSAPETIRSLETKKQYCPSAKVDVYSLGILSLEVFCRKKPWGQSFDAVKVVAGERPKISLDVSDSSLREKIMNFLRRCWCDSPNDRPTMEEVYQFWVAFKIMTR